MSITISTKVPEELAERIDEAREEGENTSACVRRLLRDGLDDDDHGGYLPPHLYAIWLGSLLVLATVLEPATVSGTAIMGAGIALVLGGAVYQYTQ